MTPVQRTTAIDYNPVWWVGIRMECNNIKSAILRQACKRKVPLVGMLRESDNFHNLRFKRMEQMLADFKLLPAAAADLDVDQIYFPKSSSADFYE